DHYGGALMARKKTQAYTEEFRREAVKRSEQPGVTQAQVAKELARIFHEHILTADALRYYPASASISQI
ncbi:transposase, partial [Amphritea pacifica]